MVSILNTDLPFKTQPLTFIHFKQKRLTKKNTCAILLKNIGEIYV